MVLPEPVVRMLVSSFTDVAKPIAIGVCMALLSQLRSIAPAHSIMQNPATLFAHFECGSVVSEFKFTVVVADAEVAAGLVLV